MGENGGSFNSLYVKIICWCKTHIIDMILKMTKMFLSRLPFESSNGGLTQVWLMLFGC